MFISRGTSTQFKFSRKFSPPCIHFVTLLLVMEFSLSLVVLRQVDGQVGGQVERRIHAHLSLLCQLDVH